MTLFLAGLAIGAVAAGAAAYAAIRRRDQLYGRFFSFAAHELNTPITAINMTVLNFLSGVFGDIPSDQLKWLEMMRSQTARLNGIVGEFRDLIHHQLKKDLAIRVEPVSIEETVETVLESVNKGVPDLDLEVRLPPESPKILADADRFSRTIITLIFHARKFRASGKIGLEVGREGERLAVKLSYLGLRIPPEDVRRSLDLFYPGYKRRDQLLNAIGMGLGTARAVTELQGGSMEFDVDAEGLSRLSLFLPIAK